MMINRPFPKESLTKKVFACFLLIFPTYFFTIHGEKLSNKEISAKIEKYNIKASEVVNIVANNDLLEDIQIDILMRAARKKYKADQKSKEAIEKANEEVMKTLITKYPDVINKKKYDYTGYTRYEDVLSAIETSVQYNNVRCTKLLMKQENIQEEDLYKALLLSLKYPRILRELLKNKNLDINRRYKSGPYEGGTLLSEAVGRAWVDALEVLLEQDNIDPYIIYKGATSPIYDLATKVPREISIEDRLRGMKAFLENSRFNPKREKYYQAALEESMEYVSVFKLLLNSPKTDVTDLFYKNKSLLHLIVEKISKLQKSEKQKTADEFKKILQELLNRRKIDPALKDNEGKKAADYIEDERIKEVLEEAEEKFHHPFQPEDDENNNNKGNLGQITVIGIVLIGTCLLAVHFFFTFLQQKVKK